MVCQRSPTRQATFSTVMQPMKAKSRCTSLRHTCGRGGGHTGGEGVKGWYLLAFPCSALHENNEALEKGEDRIDMYRVLHSPTMS